EDLSAVCSSRDHSRSTSDGRIDGTPQLHPRTGWLRWTHARPPLKACTASSCLGCRQARDANTGPGNLVAPVDGNQDRGKRLRRNRVCEASAIAAAGRDDARERDDLFANVNIVGKHQHVAIDLLAAV